MNGNAVEFLTLCCAILVLLVGFLLTREDKAHPIDQAMLQQINSCYMQDMRAVMIDKVIECRPKKDQEP